MAEFTPQEIEQFLQEFFDVVGARQYVGARYVPIFGRAGENTVEWDDGAPYEPLTVVMHEGVSYVSRRYVPAGVAITDTSYWVETYRFNAQVEQYRQEVLGFQGQIDALRDDLESDYVPFPDPDHYPKYGTLGQVLSTLADGTTLWQDPVVPSDEQAEEIITGWLDEHPEATTTVQDGAITRPKLATSLFDSLLTGTHQLVTPSNYATVLPDADLQPNNSILCVQRQITSTMTQNLPVYGKVGILVKLNFRPDMVQGCAQLYLCRDEAITDTSQKTRVYCRVAYGGAATPTFDPWQQLNPLEVGSIVRGVGESFLVHTSDYATRLPDADYQPNNSVFCLTGGITAQMTQNLPVYGKPGMLVRLAYSPNQPNGTVQLFFERRSASDMVLHMRMSYGASDTVPDFTPWVQVNGVTNALLNDRLSHRTCSIFRKVVCCGDSYTAGWIAQVATNEDYAWPHYMEVITGGTYVNCGDSGETTLSWQTATRGLPKATQAGVAQAYIIGLMINDVELSVPLGTSADIGTQAQTYYGGLSQIVEALHAISPQAKIFIQTCPRTTDTYQPYNQAVRDVVTHYAQTMSTHLLDLYDYLPLYTRASIANDAYQGHYTAIGYQQFAENLAYVMSDYINAHPVEFRDVYSLPTS